MGPCEAGVREWSGVDDGVRSEVWVTQINGEFLRMVMMLVLMGMMVNVMVVMVVPSDDNDNEKDKEHWEAHVISSQRLQVLVN